MKDKLRPFADFLLGLALVMAFDVLAFHQGFYYSWLRPDSYSGRVEESSRRFAAMRELSPLRQVVVMSNSTGASCVAEQVLEETLQAAGWPLAAVNLSAGGSSARAWYYLLGREEVSRKTTALVVLGVHPMGLIKNAGKVDLQNVKTRLALADLATLPASFETGEQQLQAASMVLFRTPLFREDLVDLLKNPQARFAAVAKARRAEDRFRKGWRRAIRSRENLSSARLGEGGKLDRNTVAPEIAANPELVAMLEIQLARRAAGGSAPAPMSIGPDQAAMLRRTVRLLDGRGIAVVVAVTPESPFPPPGHQVEALVRLIGELQREGLRVRLFHDTRLLDTLETPLYFRDPLHVNAFGAEIYSRGLAAYLAAAFAGSELEIEERRGVLRSEEDRRPDREGDQEGP